MNESAGKRRLPVWLLGTVLIAAVSHLLAVYAYPRVLMRGVYAGMVETADATGVVHAPRPDAGMRAVVRPSPDILYSVCVYDLTEGQWSMGLDLPETYVSVSLFAMNTDNFFTVNDRELRRRRLDMRIVQGAVDDTPTAGEPVVVRSPDTRGVALFRFFAGSGRQATEIEAARRSIRCGVAPANAEMSPSAGIRGGHSGG